MSINSEVNAPLAPHMKTALFTNFTDQDFTGYWDGKGKKFAPGQTLYMPDYLARHFAKHLVNRELLRTDGNGNLVYKDGDKMTSPKKPEDVPLFMELFNKAYTPDESDELGETRDDIDTLIAVANKNKHRVAEDAQPNPRANAPQQVEQKQEAQDPTKPQIVVPPDFNDDDDESSFQGKPTE